MKPSRSVLSLLVRLSGGLVLIVTLHASILAQAAAIPDRPEKLTFPDLRFDVPEAQPLRATLSNGVAVYIIEDRALPLINIGLRMRGGSYLQPEGKEGLAQLTSTLWRSGGAGELSGKQLDEEIAFLAAGLSTSIGSTSSTVSLNLLSKDVDRGLELLMDVLLRPRFEGQRMDRARTNVVAAMRRRNDSTAVIERREWSRLLFGEDFWRNRMSTEASVNSITRQDMVDFHKRLVRSDDMIVAVSGDFSRAEMLARLDDTIGQLDPRGDKLPEVPQPTHTPKPGLYVVDKPDVNQGRVRIGHVGLKRPVAEEFALMVANDVLGGGGFTSWILSRVRSDEGLAYSAGSSFSIGDTLPGTFRASFQSKSSTVARAAQLTVELMGQLQAQGISEKELVTSRNSFVETFPNRFSNKFAVVARYANDELVGRDHAYWTNFRERIRDVTAGSARRAAREYIHPDKLIVLIVGNIAEILKGHPDYPDARLEDLGPMTRLPLRDPMTQEPIAPPAGQRRAQGDGTAGQ